MNLEKDILMKEEQRKDLLIQAEQYRLVQQALAGKPSSASFWKRLLHWLGHQLDEIRCFLRSLFDRQARSSTIPLGLYPCEE